ncbi:cell division cycle- protein [Mycoemilia scoparia]|uniref:Cell division cycle- protein n=1 Tax=Mycoemilia scoparia TaxID=417184 RepID=A0A9W8DNI4_9FUNG|nr:cell division cycle- protein [Mycoemilia scoparia]
MEVKANHSPLRSHQPLSPRKSERDNVPPWLYSATIDNNFEGEPQESPTSRATSNPSSESMSSFCSAENGGDKTKVTPVSIESTYYIHSAIPSHRTSTKETISTVTGDEERVNSSHSTTNEDSYSRKNIASKLTGKLSQYFSRKPDNGWDSCTDLAQGGFNLPIDNKGHESENETGSAASDSFSFIPTYYRPSQPHIDQSGRPRAYMHADPTTRHGSDRGVTEAKCQSSHTNLDTTNHCHTEKDEGLPVARKARYRPALVINPDEHSFLLDDPRPAHAPATTMKKKKSRSFFKFIYNSSDGEPASPPLRATKSNVHNTWSHDSGVFPSAPTSNSFTMSKSSTETVIVKNKPQGSNNGLDSEVNGSQEDYQCTQSQRDSGMHYSKKSFEERVNSSPSSTETGHNLFNRERRSSTGANAHVGGPGPARRPPSKASTKIKCKPIAHLSLKNDDNEEDEEYEDQDDGSCQSDVQIREGSDHDKHHTQKSPRSAKRSSTTSLLLLSDYMDKGSKHENEGTSPTALPPITTSRSENNLYKRQYHKSCQSGKVRGARAGGSSLPSTPVRKHSRCMSMLLQQGPHGGIRRLESFQISKSRGGEVVSMLSPALVDMLNVKPMDEFTLKVINRFTTHQRRYSTAPNHKLENANSPSNATASTSSGTPLGDAYSEDDPGTPWPSDTDDISNEVAYSYNNTSGANHERKGSTAGLADTESRDDSKYPSSAPPGTQSRRFSFRSSEKISTSHQQAINNCSHEPLPASAPVMPVYSLNGSYELKGSTMQPGPGGLKAASLRVMVHWLASPLGDVDSEYIKTFLASYRFFAHPVDLLRLLIVRYVNCFKNPSNQNTPSSPTTAFKPVVDSQNGTVVQLRVLNILKQWIRFHPHDFKLHSRLTRLLLLFLTFIRSQPGRNSFVSKLLERLKTGQLLSTKDESYSTSNISVVSVSTSNGTISTPCFVSKPTTVDKKPPMVPSKDYHKSSVCNLSIKIPHNGMGSVLHLPQTPQEKSPHQNYDQRNSNASNKSSQFPSPQIKRVQSAGNLSTVTSLSQLHGVDIHKPLPPRPKAKKSSSSYFMSILGRGKRSQDSAHSLTSASRESLRSSNHSVTNLSIMNESEGINLRLDISDNGSARDFSSDVLTLSSAYSEQPQTPVSALGNALKYLSTSQEPSERFSIHNIDPLHIAQQFGLIEQSMFSKISVTEFSLKSRCAGLSQKFPFSDGSKQNMLDDIDSYAGLESSNPIPNLSSFTKWFNYVTYWAILTILTQQSPQMRAAAITRLIHISYHCLALRNYATSLEISAALKNSTITRLKSSWNIVPQVAQDALNRIVTVWHSKPNFQLYRESIKAALQGRLGPDNAAFSSFESLNSSGSLLASRGLSQFSSAIDFGDQHDTNTPPLTPSYITRNPARFSGIPPPGPTASSGLNTKCGDHPGERRTMGSKFSGFWNSASNLSRTGTNTSQKHNSAKSEDLKFIEQARSVRYGVQQGCESLSSGTGTSTPSSGCETHTVSTASCSAISGATNTHHQSRPFPVVPFIGLHMTDLLHTDEANPTYITPAEKTASSEVEDNSGYTNEGSAAPPRPASPGSKNTHAPPLINFHKIRTISTMLKELNLAQITPYTFEADVALQSWITRQVNNVPTLIGKAHQIIREASINDSLVNSSSGEIPTPTSQKFEISRTPSTTANSSENHNNEQKTDQQLEQELFAISRVVEPATAVTHNTLSSSFTMGALSNASSTSLAQPHLAAQYRPKQTSQRIH